MNEPRLEKGWAYPNIGYIDIHDELENKLTSEELQLLNKLSTHVDFPSPLIWRDDNVRVRSYDELSELAEMTIEETKGLFESLIKKEAADYQWMQPKGGKKYEYFYLNPYIFVIAKDVGAYSYPYENSFIGSYWADYNRKHFKVKFGKVSREKYSYRRMKINPDFWDYEFNIEDADDTVRGIVKTLNKALKGHKYVSFYRFSDGAVILFSHSRDYSHPSISIENDDGDIEQDIPRMRYIEQFQKECGLNYNIKVTYSGDRIKIARIDN